MALRTSGAYMAHLAYTARDDRNTLYALTRGKSGVARPDDLKVTPGAAGAVRVNVAGGDVFHVGQQESRQGTYHAYNDGTASVALDPGDATNPRVDAVCAEWLDQEYGAAESLARLRVIKGVPAASPTGLTLAQLRQDHPGCYRLADVTVTAGRTSPPAAGDIVDRRELVEDTTGMVIAERAFTDQDYVNGARTVDYLFAYPDPGRKYTVAYEGTASIDGTVDTRLHVALRVAYDQVPTLTSQGLAGRLVDIQGQNRSHQLALSRTFVPSQTVRLGIGAIWTRVHGSSIKPDANDSGPNQHGRVLRVVDAGPVGWGVLG